MESRTTIQHLLPEALKAAAANKTIELQLAWYVNTYKVLRIKNTTILKPGEWLSVAAVDQINDTPNWDVDMGDNELIQTLFGFGTDAAKAGMRLP